MEYGLSSAKMIDFDRVYLDQDNPRHEPFDNQGAVIEYLCRDEQVLPLARDIAKNGLNPLELFALISDGENTYVSAEGNRRLCALKLLNDPDLAPANQRKDFERVSTSWNPIHDLFAIVFNNRDEVRLWLDRIHAGFAEGRGRRQWNADQKARNSGYSKNDLAQAVLDAGEERDFISTEERKGRLSTVQRYLGNPVMRNALGLDVSDLDNLTTDLLEDEFKIVLRQFMKDVAHKLITTRENAHSIREYANKLNSLPGVSGVRDEKRPISMDTAIPKSRPKSSVKRPPKLTNIPHSDELEAALQSIPSYKLERIYYSLCTIRIDSHTPLLYVGAWSFIETLTALEGRKPKVDFLSYLSSQKLQNLGLGVNRETKSLRDALKRISDHGNSTKHHKSAAAFNGEQLANDFETMESLLIALAEGCKEEN